VSVEYVNTGSGYAGLQAWWDSRPAIFTEVETVFVDNMLLVEHFLAGGKTTSAAFYAEIIVLDANRHGGIPGVGARIVSPDGAAAPFRINVPHLRVSGLEMYQDTTTTQPALQFLSGAYVAGSDVRIDSCMPHDLAVSTTSYTIAGTSNSLLNLKLTNNITYGSRRSIDTRNSVCESHNNIWYRHNASLGPICDSNTTRINDYSGAAVAGQECFWTAGSPPSGSNNVSSDATATIDTPTGSQNNIAGSAVFVSVTSGSENFNLLNGTTALHNSGATVASVTLDAKGVSRPQGASYDVGPFEWPEAGTSDIAAAGSGVASGTGDIESQRDVAGSASTTATGSGQLNVGVDIAASDSATAEGTAGAVSGLVGDVSAAGAGVAGGVATLSTGFNAGASGSGTAIGAAGLVDLGLTGSFTTTGLESTPGTAWLSTAVLWTWTPNGRIGSVGGTPIVGSGTTHATTGALTATGLPLGDGELKWGILGATPQDDKVGIEYGTAT